MPEDRARVFGLSERDQASRFQAPALVRIIRKVRPDIVHARNWSGIEGVMAASWMRSRAVLFSEHGLDGDPSVREPWRRSGFRRLAYELADRVFCVSDQLRRLYADRTGFPLRRMGVIHNGVDAERFTADPTTRRRIRQALDLDDSGFCIGCVANLTPVKDYITLLRAVAEFAGRAGNWRLVIVGEGPQRGALEAFVDANPRWRNCVRFWGFTDCVAQLLNAFDVYVLTSLTEGISNSLLEAMAAGLPVIATATGGNPEVVVDGESGLLFPVGDSARLALLLRALQEQPARRAELGRRALQRVREEFSLPSMIRKYEQLYGGLASSRQQ